MQVDSLLQQHPDVAEAATFAVPEPIVGQFGETAVVLSAQSHTSREAAPAALKRFIASKLEEYKVISAAYLLHKRQA